MQNTFKRRADCLKAANGKLIACYALTNYIIIDDFTNFMSIIKQFNKKEFIDFKRD